MFQRLECRGASVFIHALGTMLVLAYMGFATLRAPEMVFDGGASQTFWVGIGGFFTGGLATALSGTKRNGNGNGAAA